MEEGTYLIKIRSESPDVGETDLELPTVTIVLVRGFKLGGLTSFSSVCTHFMVFSVEDNLTNKIEL